MPVNVGKYCGLIKLGTYEHMSRLYGEGELYFNTFKYFRGLEKSEDGRGDDDEYLDSYYAKGTKLAIKRTTDADFTPIGEVENFKIKDTSLKRYTHLYCMSSINKEWTFNNKFLLQSKNFATDKNYAVIVHDIPSFFKLIQDKFNELKYPMKSGYVEYVSRESYCGKFGCFKKFDEYSYQNEFRFVARFENESVPKIIKLGSLSKVAFKPKSKEEFDSLKIMVEFGGNK